MKTLKTSFSEINLSKSDLYQEELEQRRHHDNLLPAEKKKIGKVYGTSVNHNFVTRRRRQKYPRIKTISRYTTTVK